jgi:DNA mismatch repair protein MutL
MPIAKLDEATTMLLASSVNITSPVDLVKELIDNAIDAKADLIEILISPNTLDQIRVRDNGCGISVDDLDGLGRPAHTSKLQNFEQLATHGVCTLGFRGQALASANATATIYVVTKTADEPVATRVRLAFGVGGIAERYPPVSGTKGTTVQANNLFEDMRPRKQLLLKEGKKSITRIKEMLTAYGVANPFLRMLFRVSGNEKYFWKCGHPGVHGLMEKAMEIFGRELAANCNLHTLGDANNLFALETLLPNGDCAVEAVKGKGYFISVNGRPISSTCGVGKALVARFRTQFTQCLDERGITAVQQPFCIVRIKCSPALYDANVASMKDEVLFADEKALLECFDGLCRTAYADEPQAQNHQALQSLSVTAKGKPLQKNSFKKTPEKPIVAHNGNDSTKRVAAKMRTNVKVNMSRTESATDDDEAMIDVTIPEKQNKSVTAQKGPKDVEKQSSTKSNKQLLGIERYLLRASDFDIAMDATATQEIMQPSCSGTEEIDVQEHTRQPLQTLSPSALNIMANHVDFGSDVGNPEMDNVPAPSTLRSHLNRRNTLPLEPPIRRDRQTLDSPSPPLSPLIRGRRPGPAPMGRALATILHTPPSSDPARNERQTAGSQDGYISRRAPESSPLRGFGQPAHWSAPRHSESGIDGHRQALQNTRTSSRRVAQRRGVAARATRIVAGTAPSIRAGVPDASSGLRAEHEEALWRNLTTLEDETEPQFESMAMDPVEYSHIAQVMLMRSPPKSKVPERRSRSRSRSGRSVSRTNSAILPLETIPFGQQTFDKMKFQKISMMDVQKHMRLYVSWEQHTADGKLACTLPPAENNEARDIERRLNFVVQAWKNEGS